MQRWIVAVMQAGRHSGAHHAQRAVVGEHGAVAAHSRGVAAVKRVAAVSHQLRSAGEASSCIGVAVAASRASSGRAPPLPFQQCRRLALQRACGMDAGSTVPTAAAVGTTWHHPCQWGRQPCPADGQSGSSASQRATSG